MILLPSFLAMLPEKPSFLETITYQINGLLIVFAVLGALWLLMELIGARFKRRDAKLQQGRAAAQEAGAAAAPPGPKPASGSGAIEPEVVAAVAAAVSTVLEGRRHRVVSVAPRASRGHAAPDGRVWAVEGRRDIFASHKTR